MEHRIEQIDPHSGRIRIVRLKTPGVRTSQFKLLVRKTVLNVRAAREPLNQPHVVPLSRAAEARSPAVRARRATRRLRRHLVSRHHYFPQNHSRARHLRQKSYVSFDVLGRVD
jgi:hypothetical protein